MKGADAEERTLAYLTGQGHQLLARNYRIRGGEIDLITRQGEVIVFVEVKHRTRVSYGSPLEGVSVRKILRLRRTALFYLLRTFGTDQLPCRFDVVAIAGPVCGGTLEHVENAF
ncbi:YraN family protein [Deinococcus peraridilitoris]|uniref:UPF0102 protein Deipe_0630 n=1 Tax=Deinococcus peraridilitoris (strain DSM 19664 / LMG 22246 / CIP 109416 / KR-200) TaxID=937777 RepID=K9ZYE5_DEIPD|nr:YraN family protein [Deinococcus peraridilitoris]AFZ66219.1 TIGR00252 family protein [Deinococcus peraridilitoris DSM 19664]